jgi:hypothetical protein
LRSAARRRLGRVVWMNMQPSLIRSWLNSPQKIELYQVSDSSSSKRRSIRLM